MKKILLSMMLIGVFVLCGCANNVKTGVELLEERKFEDAKISFQKEIEKEKNFDEAYRGLGIACFELGEYEEAASAFESAIKNETEETASLLGLMGACYIEMSDYEKALDVYTKALADEEITEELKQEIQINLISVYENMGNWDAAKKQMETYTKNYPDDTRVDKEADFLETR